MEAGAVRSARYELTTTHFVSNPMGSVHTVGYERLYNGSWYRQELSSDEWQKGLFGGKAYKRWQYTGLKDKNGAEIYEGDIVKDGGNLGVIKWLNGGFVHDQLLTRSPIGVNHLHPNSKYEVVGNIYSNPELLKSDNLQEAA